MSRAISPPSTAAMRSRAASFALVARLIGPDTSYLADGETLDALRLALATADDPAAARRLAAFPTELPAADALAGRWVRWFDLGRVAPYEGSNTTDSAGGVTPRLADVAGFYRAFGVAVAGDRPDHVVAQLEFLAVATIAEAEAIEGGDAERAALAAAATRAFVRDHIGGWIDAWAARVAAIDELAPWAPIAAVAADLVRSEAARRHVIPLRDYVAFPADAGIADDVEGMMLCEDQDIPAT